MTAIDALALIMLAALTLYALLAGADFGGGVWDLLSTSPAQRKLITKAMAPVWEANHVWLILLIVVLFTAFPPAFAQLLTVLHVPLTLMLVGIVLRGSAFVFRQYGGGGERADTLWGRVFAISSTATPVFLGASLGVMTTGAHWTSPFCLLVGFFTLSLFAMLAAVYLTVEDAELAGAFRVRALAAALVAGALAAVTALAAPGQLVSWPFVAAGAVLGSSVIATLWLRRYLVARALAVLLVTLVVAGWGLGQYPYLLVPTLTFAKAAAPQATLRLLLPTLGIGALVLFPSLYWLIRVFKRVT